MDMILQDRVDNNMNLSQKMIYADYNGSAPIVPEVTEYLIQRLQGGNFCNPNASHKLGLYSFMTLEICRSRISKVLGCKPKNIIFNSGATEGISTIFNTLLNNSKSKNVVILSGIEHAAIYNNAKLYEEKGFEFIIIPTLASGVIDTRALKDLLSEYGHKCSMVCAMAANNETGVIQPYQEIVSLCNQSNVPYFCDTTQFIGKTEFNFLESGIDYAVTSGHKFGAMTGTGIILAKDVTTIKPIVIGGGQEKCLRGGTQHYLGLETLPIALETFSKNLNQIKALSEKRIQFETEISERFPNVSIVGGEADRLATTTYISYPSLKSADIQKEMQKKNVLVTTSSACSDSKSTISRVLCAMDKTEEIGLGVIRISLGLSSPLSYYDEILEQLTQTYTVLLNK